MDLWIVNFPGFTLFTAGKPGSQKDTFKIQSKGGRIKPWPLSGVNRAADVSLGTVAITSGKAAIYQDLLFTAVVRGAIQSSQ